MQGEEGEKEKKWSEQASGTAASKQELGGVLKKTE
jgi:hypothetical protein